MDSQEISMFVCREMMRFVYGAVLFGVSIGVLIGIFAYWLVA